MSELEQSQWERLISRLARHLQNALPDDYRQLGTAAVREMARVAVETGRRRGLTRDIDFFRWFNVRYLLGAAVEQEQWAVDILEHPAMQMNTKLDLLESEYRQHQSAGGSR